MKRMRHHHRLMSLWAWGALFCVTPWHLCGTDYPDVLSGNDRFMHEVDDFFDAVPMTDEINLQDDGFPRDPCGCPSPRVTQVNPEDVVQFLCEDLKICSLLEEDLYLRTNPLNKRNLVDLPVFEPMPCCYANDRVISGYLFWNQTNRGFFSSENDALKCYLALSQTTLLDKLRGIQEFIGTQGDFAQIIDIDLKKIFGLFCNMTIQERRAGLMFHFYRQWENVRMRVLWPLAYLERNYYMTRKEQKCAERELAQAFGIQNNKKQQDCFQRRYLIGDRLGMGDMRIEIDGQVYCRWFLFGMRIGAQLTLPIAFSFKKGLYGSYFPKSCKQPRFSILELADILESEGSQEEKTQEVSNLLEPFFLGTLTRLSSMLIDTGLGNDGHFGIGPFIRSKTNLGSLCARCDKVKRHCPQWLDRLTWHSRMSLELLMPKTKKWYFIKRDDPEAFASRDFSSDDPVVATDNLRFLDCEFVNKFYPRAFDVKIKPRFIFRSTSKMCYDGCNWDFYVGTDTWVMTQEKIADVCAPSGIKKQLNLCKADSFLAYQGKAIMGFVYHLERPCYDWYFSIHGDGAIASKGIGRDATLAICVDCTF